MNDLRLLIASTSTIKGTSYLEYLQKELELHFDGINEIIFIPFARPGGISHDAYTEIAHTFFRKIGINVRSITTFSNMPEALLTAKGIFTGGGNSFVLLHALYLHDLLSPLKEILRSGAPYLGTSAGANILGPTIMTTNDMPIVYPPSFDALSMVPFQINPHFIDADKNSKHMGETRETRIKEYLKFNYIPVAGIREGSFFKVLDGKIRMGGNNSIRMFPPGEEPYELNAKDDIQYLLTS